MNIFPSHIKLKGDVIHDDTEYAFEDIAPPTFISEEDVIDDIPQEIIIETLCCKMMGMSGFEPMTLVLC